MIGTPKGSATDLQRDGHGGDVYGRCAREPLILGASRRAQSILGLSDRDESDHGGSFRFHVRVCGLHG